MKKSLLLIAPFILSACAGSQASVENPATASGNEMCDGEALKQFVGQTVSPELGMAALSASGARTLRWAPPRSAVTMDYRPDRITIGYDDDQKITTISCG